MPVKLHYGPPGAYKTSGAVLDDLPVALKEGRVLITNIRGLDDPDKVKATYREQKQLFFFDKYKVSDDFDIIFIDTKKEEGREKLRYFFHWAPQDAYFIIDEINTIYPKKWTEKKLEEFDLHKGSESELLDPKNHLIDRHNQIAYGVDELPILRPQNVVEALEMHRHFNWDFSCTSPSYKKFNPLFHDVAEVAYKHINRGVIGMSGSYWEHMHLATNSGTSRADVIQDKTRKIPQFIFDLYGSTATGQVRDTTAGNNVFLQPKLLGVLILIVSLLSSGVYLLKNSGLIQNNSSTINAENIQNEETQKSKEDEVPPTNDKNSDLHNTVDTDGEYIKTSTDVDNTSVYSDDYLQDYEINVAGVLMGEKLIIIKQGDKQRQTNINTLVKLGYSFEYIDRCNALITHPRFKSRYITCELKDQSTDYSLLPDGKPTKAIAATEKREPMIANPFKSAKK